jgi:molybdenum cofactor cytidylyltransferase
MRRTAGILLAAGLGARFGAHKLFVPLADGTPLAVGAARPLRLAMTDEVFAVVRPGDNVLSALLIAEGLRVVECPQAEQGMAHSLAAGIAAAPDVEGWVIALADMPYIKVPTIARIAQALSAGAVLAAPFHQDRRGHPVGFSVALRAELAALQGDVGAREILARHARVLTRIDVDDPGILLDVDTPADLASAAGPQNSTVAPRNSPVDDGL